jgi:imidazolonepropionase-like amidohydrolase
VLALRASRLIDGTGAHGYGPATILVDGDLIAEVGPSEAVHAPAGAEVISLGDLTLLPGLVDAHTHFGLAFPHGGTSGSNYEILLRGTDYARRCLLSGVTTARTLSERDFLDVGYRKAIAEGWIEGPRTLIATRGLQPTHSRVSVTDVQVNDPDEVRRVVRENLAAGADLIKLYLTPPSASATPTQAYFSPLEIQTAVEEAHRAGRPVTVHAHGGPAVDDAIDAGVDTIEHGIYITPDQFKRMAERGTWLIGTQTIRLWETDESRLTEPLRNARDATKTNLAIARDLGVNISVGTDGAHGLMYFEVECLVRAGFPPMEAIQAGTKRAAEAIGLGSRTGTLEPGKWADVIAVAGDPLADIRTLKDVAFVMKAGRVVKGPDPYDRQVA